MASYDVVVKDGIVVDGTGVGRYRADVAVKDGVIADLGRIPDHEADEVLGAEGMIVAPGFIDLHTHYDAQLFWDPYCTLSGWHGVTSVVIGNCGFGFAPVAPELRERSMLTMTRTEAIPYKAMAAGLPWDWVTYPEFLDAVDRTDKSVNVRPFLPLNPLLTWVLGFERAKEGVRPTDDEHREMRRLLHDAMDAGAGGWSAQRLMPQSGAMVQRDHDGTPMATDVMHDETCFALAEVLAERNQGFVQMTMAGDPAVPDHSAQTFERIAEISGRPILYNVVQAFADRPGLHLDRMAWLDRCRERGLRVYGQAVTTAAGFTLTFEDWNLFDESDAWVEATTGTPEQRLTKLADPARRERLRTAYDREVFATTRPVAEWVVLGPKSSETMAWKEHTVGDVAEARGVHPVDALLDIAVADGLRTTFYAEPVNNDPDQIREILANRWTIPGVSDGGAHTRFLTAGRYPTELLCQFVRDDPVLSLEEAHFRLSALPAHCAGFRNRGTIEVGRAADLVVYDLDHLGIGPVEQVHDFPAGEWRRVQRAHGYRYVLVNGRVTIDDDKETGVPAGQLVRGG